MIQLIKMILRILPWLMVVVLLAWIMFKDSIGFERIEGNRETHQTTILTRIEQMGKLELVQYNFQEVTEFKKIADYIDLKLFKYKLAPDAKGVLISQGSAIGCIDLTKIQQSDIRDAADTLFLQLPPPEICNFKIDLEKSRLYDLQISYMKQDDQKMFIQELYKAAETEILNTALTTGILEQTQENPHLILKPMLEDFSGKKVIITFKLNDTIEQY